MGWAGSAWASAREETVINNYYDEPGRSGEHGEHQTQDQGGAQFNDGGYNAGTGYDPRSNDPNDNLRGFDDQNASSANDQDLSAANDPSNFDDQANLDNQNLDDGGSGFDDSGGFDGGGSDGGDSSGF